MYPVKKSKQAAIRAWDSLRPDDRLLAVMGHALQRQLASPEWQRKIREEDAELVRHLTLLERLVLYGNYELFVINTSNTGMISMNVLPLSFKYTGGNSGAVGQLALSLESPDVVPVQAVEIVEKIIRNMNIVLEQIVPGLTISVKEMGAQIMGNGGSRQANPVDV